MKCRTTPSLTKYLNLILVASLLLGTGVLEPLIALAAQLETTITEDVKVGIEEIISESNEGGIDKQVLEENTVENDELQINELAETLSSNITPLINVELVSESIVSAKHGDEIEVTYQITPESFSQSNFSNTEDKNIAILFDVSKDNKYLDSYMMNALDNMIANHFKSNKGKFAIIPYSDTVELKVDDPIHPNGWYDQIHNFIRGLKSSNSNERKLGSALSTASKFFDSLSNGYSNHIVIVTMGNPTDSLPNLNFSQYNVVVLAVNSSNNTVETDYKVLYEWFNKMSSTKDNYIVGKNDGNEINNTYGTTIKDRINGASIQNNINSTLNFDLGSKFSHVSGLEHVSGTTYKINVPQIEYLQKSQNSDGTYNYEAKPIEVKFTVRVNSQSTGTITFNNPDSSESNYFVYNDFNGNKVPNINIETPSVYIGETYTNDSIKILEIEPADYFQLGSKKGLTTGTEELTINGEKVEITRITMPEFIGTVEKINGKYDIVVLGRIVNKNWGTDLNKQTKYQDYNFTRTESFEENDITNRKAQEIIDFIDSGQLVYIDKNIFDTGISDTKLYRNFVAVSGTNLIRTKSVSELSIERIVQHYKDNVLVQQKQLLLQVTDATASDITSSNLDVADGVAANRTRKMIVSATSLNNSVEEILTEDVSINLYLDLNGDGLYSDDEVAVSRDNLKTPLNDLILHYNIHPDFLGLLSWKLEVTKGDSKNPIKTYVTGDMNFHRLPDRPKKEINVLHLIPQSNYESADKNGNLDNNGKYEVLNLSINSKFQTLLDDVALKDYNIEVTTISVSRYNQIMNKTANLSLFEVGVKELNGYYDMLILGFGDCYTGCGPTFGINDAGVQNIYDFVETGQGLMLTHDTLFYQRDTNIENSKNSMLNLFRGISGQSRYGLGSNGVYTALKDLDGSNIPFDPDKPSITSLSKYSGSASVWADTGSMGNVSKASNIYETNVALITEYPFNLITTGNTLRIRTTHAQYLQLNLEDEAVIPWYTLYGSSDSRMNPYDVRNNYYTYSRNNITFSGTGENKRENAPYPDLEMKLFINTIIKAERGANHAPTVELVNISKSTVISKHQGDLSFSVIPYDMDLDQMKLSIEVFGCTNNICSDTSILEQKDSEFVRVNGVGVDVEFDIKNKLTNFDQIKIKVVATDEHHASSQAAELVIQLTNQALLDVSFTADKIGYLIGDEAVVTANIKANGDSAKDGIFSLLTPISSLISLQSSSVGLTSFNFNIGQNETLNKTFKFIVNNHKDIQTDNNKAVNVSANYSYCLNINSQSCVELPETPDTKTAVLNVKRGQIIVEFSSNVATLFNDYEVAIQLLDSNKNILTTQRVTNSNNVIFDAVPSGDYFVKIIKPDTLSEDDYILQSLTESLVNWETLHPASVSYTENIEKLSFELNQVRFDLVHGLFKSQSNNQIVIEPSIYQNPKQVTGNTLVNFAATYTTKHRNNDAILTVSNKLNNFKKDSIKIYKLEKDTSSGALTIKPFVGAMVTQVEQEYHITLPENTNSDVKVLIYYTGLVANEDINYLTNTLQVGATNEDVVIRVNEEVIINPDPNSYLPDLF